MDVEKLRIHIAVGDYFGTLATVLDLLRQDAEQRGWRPEHAAALAKMRDDLVWLQRNYRITQKPVLGSSPEIR